MKTKRFIALALAVLLLGSALCFVSCGVNEDKSKTEDLTKLFIDMFGAYNNEDFVTYTSYYKTKTQSQIDYIIENLTEGSKYIKRTYEFVSLTHEELEDGRTIATVFMKETITDLTGEDKTVTTNDVTAQAVLSKTEDASWSVDDLRMTFAGVN